MRQNRRVVGSVFVIAALILSACGGGDGSSSGVGVTPQIDSASPVISSLTVQSSLSTQATVNWQTNEPANHIISYGISSSLGQNAAPQVAYIRNHSTTLSGLTLNTRYYYQITTSDANNNITVSPVYSFITNNPGGPYTLLYDANFDSGTLGTTTLGVDAFSGDAGRNIYTTEQVADGAQAAKLSVVANSENVFAYGGLFNYQARLGFGDEVWWRVKVFFPVGFDYDAAPKLKFMRMARMTVNGGGSAAIGYIDFYILPPNSPWAFSFDPEMDNTNGSLVFGSASDKPVLGRWETYEGYARLGHVPANQGGTSLVRFWKNGKLIFESGDRRTMNNITDKGTYGLLFTYWNNPNSGPMTKPSKNQSFYIDSIKIATSASPPTATDAQGNPFIGLQ